MNEEKRSAELQRLSKPLREKLKKARPGHPDWDDDSGRGPNSSDRDTIARAVELKLDPDDADAEPPQ
jgi:hypothetical protein